MSFSELIPAGALDREWDVVQLAPRRDERIMVCTRCDQPILVGGWVDDLDEATYVGVACGCRLQARQGEAVVTRHRAPAPSGEHPFGYPSSVESRKESER